MESIDPIGIVAIPPRLSETGIRWRMLVQDSNVLGDSPVLFYRRSVIAQAFNDRYGYEPIRQTEARCNISE